MILRWTESAVKDLQGISDCYLRHAPAVEGRIVRSIYESIEALLQFPSIGRRLSTSNARQFVVLNTPYLVTYRLMDDVIEVLRIRHGARNPLRF